MDRFRAFHVAVNPSLVVDCEGVWEVTHISKGQICGRFLSKLLLDY